MSSIIEKLMKNEKLPGMPGFCFSNLIYLTITGSEAYGVSSSGSDTDIVGVTVPPKATLFPTTYGEIEGFSTPRNRFEVYQQHHIDSTGLWGDRNKIDLSIYNIAKFFRLAMDNNPNIIDILFSPEECVLVCTQAGLIMRDNRKLFLHKGAYHKFRGYAHSQLHEIRTKEDLGNVLGKRTSIIEEYGFDVKFAYHVIRLALECEQILETGDLDLRRDSYILRDIRKGQFSLEEIIDWWTKKEKQLEKLYETSSLPYSPDEEKIKEVLLKVISCQYNDLKLFKEYEDVSKALQEIETICRNVTESILRKNNLVLSGVFP